MYLHQVTDIGVESLCCQVTILGEEKAICNFYKVKMSYSCKKLVFLGLNDVMNDIEKVCLTHSLN